MVARNTSRGSRCREQPDSRGCHAFGVLDAVGDRQAVGFGELAFLGQAARDQLGAGAGDLVDQADGLDLDHVGQRKPHGRDDQRDIHEKAEAPH
ncbi:MAG: hypothetical protein ACE368_05285 [Paracoccaceae bacterium]